MSDQLTEKQVEDYRNTFTHFDQDNNGSISVRDLATVMRSLVQSPTEAQLHDMINEVDVDGNGGIEFSEFLRMMVRKMKLADLDEELRIVFDVFDRNQDGFISPEELKSLMAALGETLTDSEIKDLIHESDLDGDGKINLQEFVHMMTSPG